MMLPAEKIIQTNLVYQLMLKIRIAEIQNFSADVVTQLRQLGEVDVMETEKQEVSQCLADYDVFWFRLKFKIEEQDFPEQVRCRYILCPVTGLDHIDLKACEQRGIQVLSLRGETQFLQRVRATAELTMALTLGLLRKLPYAIASVNTYHWQRDLFKGHEIFEKKVGIIGMGRLGSITASYFKALGAEVFGYDIKTFDQTHCTAVTDIQALVSMCDIVSVHVAYNESTHHLIDETIFNAMKPSAVLINTSRGGVVNSDHLLQALQQQQIAGAALDVIENEYAIDNNALIAYAAEHENLLITPHIGGNTWESFDKTEHFLFEKLKAAVTIP